MKSYGDLIPGNLVIENYESEAHIETVSLRKSEIVINSVTGEIFAGKEQNSTEKIKLSDVLIKDEFSQFPAEGQKNRIYLDRGTGLQYFWNPTNRQYKRIVSYKELDPLSLISISSPNSTSIQMNAWKTIGLSSVDSSLSINPEIFEHTATGKIEIKKSGYYLVACSLAVAPGNNASSYIRVFDEINNIIYPSDQNLLNQLTYKSETQPLTSVFPIHITSEINLLSLQVYCSQPASVPQGARLTIIKLDTLKGLDGADGINGEPGSAFRPDEAADINEGKFIEIENTHSLLSDYFIIVREDLRSSLDYPPLMDYDLSGHLLYFSRSNRWIDLGEFSGVQGPPGRNTINKFFQDNEEILDEVEEVRYEGNLEVETRTGFPKAVFIHDRQAYNNIELSGCTNSSLNLGAASSPTVFPYSSVATFPESNNVFEELPSKEGILILKNCIVEVYYKLFFAANFSYWVQNIISAFITVNDIQVPGTLDTEIGVPAGSTLQCTKKINVAQGDIISLKYSRASGNSDCIINAPECTLNLSSKYIL